MRRRRLVRIACQLPRSQGPEVPSPRDGDDAGSPAGGSPTGGSLAGCRAAAASDERSVHSQQRSKHGSVAVPSPVPAQSQPSPSPVQFPVPIQQYALQPQKEVAARSQLHLA